MYAQPPLLGAYVVGMELASQIPQVLAGMIKIDDLDGAGKMLLGGLAPTKEGRHNAPFMSHTLVSWSGAERLGLRIECLAVFDIGFFAGRADIGDGLGSCAKCP